MGQISGRLAVDENIDISYFVAGSGEPHVAVPAACFLRQWLTPLEETFTVIYYDQRGRGASTPVKDQNRFGIEYDVTDLNALQTHLGLEKISLIGWSYLGLMVVKYALKYPDLVNNLIQLGPLPPRSNPAYLMSPFDIFKPDDDELRRFEDMGDKGIDKTDPVEFTRQYWKVYSPMYFGDPSRAASYSPPLTCENEYASAMMASMRLMRNSLRTYDLRDRVSLMTCNMLTIHGNRDIICPFAGGREWSESAAYGKFIEVEGAGHFLFAEENAVVIDACRTFLGGSWPDEAVRIGFEDRDFRV